MPSINEMFAIEIQHERTIASVVPVLESSVLVAARFDNKNVFKSVVNKNDGRTDSNYKKPSSLSRYQNSRVNQVGSCENEPNSGEGLSSQPHVFTKEQYDSLVSLLQERASGPFNSASEHQQSQIKCPFLQFCS
ncbi:hypothetical protein V6N13_022100 [Hibiscus sabdariffa]